jgi:molybdenum-dependent DNA-binding transcriptional regulator ModE
MLAVGRGSQRRLPCHRATVRCRRAMLDVRRLRVLGEVARAGSLAGAAEALSYSPSAVSQQIATLEREVGMALVERLRPK